MEARSRWAKEEARQRYNSVEFWYRRKYNLTSNDPRYLDTTLDEMFADFWAHTYFDDPKAIENTVEDEDFDADDVARLIGADVPTEQEDIANVNDWEDVNE